MYKKVIVVICLALLLSACQKTPDEEVVIGKNDLNEKIGVSAEKAITVPDVWEENIKNENGDSFILFEASIVMPDVNTFSVASVQPTGFSQARASELVDYFSKGQPLIASNDTWTKAEIEEQIIELKEILTQAEAGNEEVGNSEEIQNQINNLMKHWETAPETHEKDIVDSTLTFDSELNREILDVNIDLGKKEYANVYIVNCNEENYESTFYFQNGRIYTPAFELHGKNAKNLNTTLIDATAHAEDILNSLSLDDYEIYTIETGIEQSNFNASAGSGQGYCITCKLQINGLPYLFCEGRDYTGITIDEETGFYVYDATGAVVEKFAPTWDVSEIKIFIDDTGVTGFMWNNPADKIHFENENVALLGFEAIQRICKQQLESTYSYNNTGIVYHIDNIELGMAAVTQKDNIGTYLLVPVWAIYGYCENNSLSDEANKSLRNETAACFLVINAIDGSVIN